MVVIGSPSIYFDDPALQTPTFCQATDLVSAAAYASRGRLGAASVVYVPNPRASIPAAWLDRLRVDKSPDGLGRSCRVSKRHNRT
jgi:hypothetical protein